MKRDDVKNLAQWYIAFERGGSQLKCCSEERRRLMNVIACLDKYKMPIWWFLFGNDYDNMFSYHKKFQE